MSTIACSEFPIIEARDGVKIQARIFRPNEEKATDMAVVLVHPYSVLGGVQGLMKGIAFGLTKRGLKAVTFDTRGAGRSTGRPTLTGSSEVNDTVDVCRWVTQNMGADRILLVGSSAGAAIAGSAVDRVDQVVGYVSLGYPFGLTSSILFGAHHKAILQSSKPKLFVMGTRDGFTSVKQLQNKLKSAAGRVETHLLEGVSHFQMEGTEYDSQMVALINDFIATL